MIFKAKTRFTIFFKTKLDPKRVNEPILAYRMRETNNYMSVSNLLTDKDCFFAERPLRIALLKHV